MYGIGGFNDHRLSPNMHRARMPRRIIMKQITVSAAILALLAGVVAVDAQGIGYGPGVNPSNPQDLTNRSNPQDLTAPGGSNRQDLVRRPSGVSVPSLTSSPRVRTQQYTAKTKAKPKAKKRRPAAQR
jgi:hypothetical protein